MFQNEDEFQVFFIREFGRVYIEGQAYAKITQIAGEFIYPEIDLLDITPILPTPTLQAFESKVLNSNIMGNNYTRIYSGIGQAFSYFKYGVDQSFLVIGISDNVPLDQATTLHRIIAEAGRAISKLDTNRFQIKLYREIQNELSDYPPFAPTGRFTRSNIARAFLQDEELARDNLCALHFPKRKGYNFFRKYGLDQYLP